VIVTIIILLNFKNNNALIQIKTTGLGIDFVISKQVEVVLFTRYGIKKEAP
jgi:hypothetical protein